MTEMDGPIGYWKDSIWDCFTLGYFHPTVWISCCCLPCAAGQVAVRIRMKQTEFMGPCVSKICTRNTANAATVQALQQSSSSSTGRMNAKCYYELFRIIALIYMIRFLLFIAVYALDPNADENVTEYIQPGYFYYVVCGIDDFLWVVYTIWTILLVYRIRSKIRTAFRIPESGLYRIPLPICSNKNHEDACCAVFCPCLSIMQTLRHTAYYDVEQARSCCSPTGLREKTSSSSLPDSTCARSAIVGRRVCGVGAKGAGGGSISMVKRQSSSTSTTKPTATV